MIKLTPQIRVQEVVFKNRIYSLEYFIREGEKGTILFVHGLGGAKENFWEALKSDALNDYCIIAFDNPGTGNSTYYVDDPLQVDDLVEIVRQFIEVLQLKDFILAGASMGGLITLRYLLTRAGNVKAYINIEGNLMPEDCMFSSKVVNHTQCDFVQNIFPQTIISMKKYGNAGYHIIANNLALNTNVISYFHYSFQTVAYSSTGELLRQFIDMDIPRLFIYGEKNRTLSHIHQLEACSIPIKMISESDHFIFYDNPKELYEAIGWFLDRL